MEKANRKSIKLGLAAVLVILAIFAVFTLTACQQGASVETLEVQEDTNPGVLIVGSSLNDLGIKLTVKVAGSDATSEVFVTSAMLTSESREQLKTPGEKHITVQYKGVQATFDILVVDAETETATAIFYDKDNNRIAAKTVVKGDAVTAPAAPEVEGLAFVEWVMLDTSASATSALRALNEDISVKAKYAQNATMYTVTVIGPDGESRGTVQVMHGNKISLDGIDTRLTSEYDASTLTWTPNIDTYIVTSNVTVHMDAQKKTELAEYFYAFASAQDDIQPLGLTEYVVPGQSGTKEAAAKTLISQKGFTFISWKNTAKQFVAIVADRNLTVSYKNNEYPSQSVLSGKQYVLPTTVAPKTGYDFDRAWKDNEGNVYKLNATGSTSIKVTRDLVLEPVYKKKAAPVKLVFDFDLIDENTGRKVDPEVKIFDDTKYGDKIDFAYVSSALDRVKSGVEKYAGFEIEKIEYNASDVTASGVTLGEIVGSTPHEFTVKVVNAELGTYDLTIVDGIVQAYTGSATSIYIPAKKGDDDVVGIAANAFENKTIARIVIPSSVKTIGDSAFAGATFGSDVQLPALTTLGANVFKNAKTARISAESEDPVYAEISVTFASGTGVFNTLSESTFEGSANIVEVALPTTVKTIGQKAFFNSSVVSVSGLENVESVLGSAFSRSAIVSLALPKLKALSGGDNFAAMEDLTALSLATATTYENSEAKLSFDFATVASCENLTELTLGKGIVGIDATGVALGNLETLRFTDNVASAVTDLASVRTLRALQSIVVDQIAASGAIYAADNGVLYSISGAKATLTVYPKAKGGDYVIPAKVNNVSVGEIGIDFAGNKLNTLSLNEAIVNGILASTPADHDPAQNVQNVVVSGSLLGTGETLNANVLKLQKYFYYARNLFIDGGNVTAAVIQEMGWNGVYVKGASDIPLYDENSGLTYEKVTANDVTTIRILFANSAASEITVPAKIGNYSVTEIAAGAFKNNTRLKTLTILATLKSFASDAVSGDVALENISIAGWDDKAEVSADAFDGTAWASSRNLLLLGGKLIKYNDFAKDEANGIYTDLVEEDFVNVSEIPDEFFKGTTNLSSVVLPASVKTIGTEAFADSSIEAIDFGMVNTVKDKAFAGATALEKVTLINVADMGKYVFMGCTGLSEVRVSATINGSVLPVGTFSGCTALSKVTFDNNALTGFAQDEDGNSNAFLGCEALTDVSFLSGVTILPGSTFAGCTALEYVDFTSVTTIGKQAFKDCDHLKVVVIRSQVESIGKEAFDGCTALEAIQFVGNGGILANTAQPLTTEDAVFPIAGTFKIYVSSNAPVTNIAIYDDGRIVRTLPKVSFAMYPGYSAGGSLGLSQAETIYMDIAPEAPAFDGYVFDAWYVRTGTEGNYVYTKVTFPRNVEENVTLYARYFNETVGSIVEADLVLDDVSGTYKLVNYTNNTDDTAFIPATFGGKAITVVYMGAFADCANLTELVLPEGVLSIKKGTPGNASAMPTHLRKLSIPASVNSIEDGALANLAELDIEFAAESLLTNADKDAFVGSKWYLEQVDLAENGRNNGFVIAGRLAIAYYGQSVQAECPTELYKLADGLFENNATIEEIIINNALTYIGDDCFKNATHLAYVTYLDASAASEEDGGNRNSALIYATAEAFSGTPWLAGKNKAIIGTIFLKFNGLNGEEAISIPDYVTVINANAFRGDGTVKEVRFGAASKVKKIGDYAFAESKLTAIELPAVEEMGNYAFASCTALRSANLNKVTFDTLPEGTFDGDIQLTTLTLSASIVALGDFSVRNCGALASITVNNYAKTNNFDDTGLSDTALYNVSAGDEAQFVVVGKVLVKYVPALVDPATTVNVPDGVEVVLAGVFENDSNITEVNLPASIKVIGQNAFFNAAALTKVVFVDNSALTEIGDMAFYNAIALKDIELPDSLVKIGSQSFANTAVEDVVIPSATTTIGYRAFYGSALQSIVIGAGVDFIGQEAFAHCEDLHKVELKLVVDDVEALDEAIKDYIDEESLGVTLAAYVENIFDKSEGSAARMYVSNEVYNYINNSALDAEIRVWNNENVKAYTEGDYPQVIFDNNDYYMEGFKTEVITELGIPAKSGHTFMGWYLNYSIDDGYSNPLVLPYEVHRSPTQIYAKWFVNALENVTSLDGMSFRSEGDGYVVTAVDKAKVVYDGVLYIPSSVAGKPVTGIDLLANVTGVTKVVLINASAFDGLTSNVFYRFPDLKEISLNSDDGKESTLSVENGVLYAEGGTVLVAYLATYTEEEELATEFIVPEKVTAILAHAFDNSGLTKVTVTAKVTAIGVHAFNDSLSELEFAQNIRLVDADDRSFENTAWYTTARTGYVVNGSTVGFFYSAGNLLFRYKQEAQTPELRIPDQLNGFNVTVIASYLYTEARGNESIAEISFDRMVLPGALQKINEKAFARVNVRVSITTASTVLNEIADEVFSHTTYYVNNNSDMIRLGNVLLKWISTAANITVPEGIVAISSEAFIGSQVQHLTLPSTIKYVGDRAFYSCSSLTSVNIPDSVLSIGDEAFAYCSALSTVTFNVGMSALKEIGAKAFFNCKKLITISLPYRLETLGDEAFNSCILLTSVTFDYVTQTAGADNTIITTVEAESKLSYLGEGAFSNCRALTSIKLPNDITAIKANTFWNCVSLKTVKFDVERSKVQVIEQSAFERCSVLGGEIDISNPSLITVVLPNSLVRLCEGAFKDCEAMFGVSFNYNVKYIEKDVFAGCKNLARINVNASTPAEIESSAFDRGDDYVYELRIYVRNSPTGSVKAEYKSAWAAYADNIHSYDEIPTLYYVVTDNNEEINSGAIESDVIVSPSWTYKGTNYTTWTYNQFARLVDGTPVVDNSALRLNMNISTGTYAVVQGGYVIVILDYDVVKLKATL